MWKSVRDWFSLYFLHLTWFKFRNHQDKFGILSLILQFFASPSPSTSSEGRVRHPLERISKNKGGENLSAWRKTKPSRKKKKTERNYKYFYYLFYKCWLITIVKHNCIIIYSFFLICINFALDTKLMKFDIPDLLNKKISFFLNLNY